MSARSEEYKSKAAQCLELAQQIGDTNSKALLLEMAQRWVELSERARDEDLGPSGETAR